MFEFIAVVSPLTVQISHFHSTECVFISEHRHRQRCTSKAEFSSFSLPPFPNAEVPFRALSLCHYTHNSHRSRELYVYGVGIGLCGLRSVPLSSWEKRKRTYTTSVSFRMSVMRTGSSSCSAMPEAISIGSVLS